MAVPGSPSQVRCRDSSPIFPSKSLTTPKVLSNMKEKHMVMITMEIMEGIKNTTRYIREKGTFLNRKNAARMDRGSRIKLVTGMNQREVVKERRSA